MRAPVLLAAVVVFAACGGDDATTTTTDARDVATTVAATTPTTNDAPISAATVPVTTGVQPEGYDLVAATAVTADGTVCELCLWVADTAATRESGLMHVTDLGAGDGMVFIYPEPHTGAFWMKNTPMPLSIAFYDQTGGYLDAFDMVPCESDPCIVYPTPDDFVYAIEVAKSTLDELGLTAGSTFTLSDLPCE